MQSHEHWESLWRLAIDKPGRPDAAQFDREALRRKRAASDFTLQVAERRQAVETLVDESIINSSSSVLEVGPGLGASTIPLAEQCGKISVIEPDTGALPMLTANLRAEGLELKDQFLVRFEDFDPGNQYDCTYAGFTPAVMHPAGLRQLERFSRGWCVLLTNMYEHSYRTVDHLYRYVFGEQRPHPPSSVYYPLNYLLSLNRSVGIRVFSFEIRHRDAAEKLIRLYQASLASTAKDDSSINRKIEKFFQSRSIDGTFTASYIRTTALLFWRPDAAVPHRPSGV